MTSIGEQSLGLKVFGGAEGEEDATPALLGSRCPTCGDVRYPRRVLCPVDLGECEELAFAGTGTLFESVRMEIAPRGFEPPFLVGFVDLDEGARLFARLDWPDGVAPSHGDRVEMTVGVVRRGEEPLLGPIFVPAG
ncbi:hypothetical protein GCM10009836_56790 [Pseudonocardia ailaonensis]|uniref:DUF35 domain-containing protein n=1 Tax=Pseudonocardia ailaonensis TaxID=367279 RepID=A0ABN2NI44_9PSEU